LLKREARLYEPFSRSAADLKNINHFEPLSSLLRELCDTRVTVHNYFILVTQSSFNEKYTSSKREKNARGLTTRATMNHTGTRMG